MDLLYPFYGSGGCQLILPVLLQAPCQRDAREQQTVGKGQGLCDRVDDQPALYPD
jgi:hypothetical protein